MMRCPHLLRPSYTVEEALERARVPEWKPVYLPGPPPSIWQELTSVIRCAWRTFARATRQAVRPYATSAQQPPT